eukprot:638536-Pleurochrysis_carterae.AAC.1
MALSAAFASFLATRIPAFSRARVRAGEAAFRPAADACVFSLLIPVASTPRSLKSGAGGHHVFPAFDSFRHRLHWRTALGLDRGSLELARRAPSSCDFLYEATYEATLCLGSLAGVPRADAQRSDGGGAQRRRDAQSRRRTICDAPSPPHIHTRTHARTHERTHTRTHARTQATSKTQAPQPTLAYAAAHLSVVANATGTCKAKSSESFGI